MDTKSPSAADRVYEDFEPYYEWDRDEGSIDVLLPGYRRDQLKVQVTSKPVLKIMGERQITENIWRRFNVELPIPSDHDTDNVTAKFEGGRLHVKFAKLVKPKETTNPPEEAPRPKEPSQKVDEVTPKAKEDKAETRTNNEVSELKEKSKTETAASIDKMDQKKIKTNNGLTETTEAATLKAPQTKDAKPVTRSKTRLLDFTLSLGPYDNRADMDNEALEDLDARVNKRKKMVKGVVLILLVAGLGLYARNALRSFHGGSEFQEL